jgi:hypothetical protein
MFKVRESRKQMGSDTQLATVTSLGPRGHKAYHRRLLSSYTCVIWKTRRCGFGSDHVGGVMYDGEGSVRCDEKGKLSRAGPHPSRNILHMQDANQQQLAHQVQRSYARNWNARNRTQN